MLNTPNWTSYLLTGMLALMTSWMLTGCRFGNRVEQSQQEGATFKHYETFPQTLTFCAKLLSTEEAHCEGATTNFIPYETSAVISNPVALVHIPGQDHQYIAHWKTKVAYPIFIESDGTFSVRSTSDRYFMWFNRNHPDTCIATDQLAIIGSTQSYPASFQNSDGITVLGKAAMTVTWITELSSSCGPAMAEVASCYTDENLCGGTPEQNAERHAAVVETFDPYVRHSGLTPSELSQVQQFAYEVSYQ